MTASIGGRTRKSFRAGQLASHLVDCLRWAGPIFSADEFDIDPSTYRPFRAVSNAALLDAFDRAVALWHFGTLEPWNLGTLELWNFSLIICLHDE